jgi:hypothetical protein
LLEDIVGAGFAVDETVTGDTTGTTAIIARVGLGITLSTTAKELVRSGLFGKDFDTYVSEIIAFLQLRFGTEVASNIVASEQGVALIEMVAFSLSTASWYGDRQADDTTLRDVRIRAAGVAIARQVGYKPYAAVPPVVDITITLEAAPPSRLTIEKGRILSGPGGLTYETVSEVVFDVGEVGPKTFAAREGRTIEEVFTSDGEPEQVFLYTTVPEGMSIAQDSPEATVGGVDWPEQRFLSFEQTNQFEFQYGFNPPRAVFGDGVAGNIPLKDAETRIKVFVTSGSAGAVTSNTVTSFQQPLSVGGTKIDATLVHNDPSTPGSDRETLSSIKVNAPLVFQAADRAVTQTDLEGLINSFVDPTYGAVAIGRANVPRSVDNSAEALTILQEIENAGVPQDVVDDTRAFLDKILASNCQTNVVNAQILATDSVGRYVTAPVGLARSLETFLEERAESTVAVHVTDGAINLLSVDLTVEIKVLDEYASATASEGVRDAARAALESALLGRAYGESLRIGDLYATVEGIEGVSYSHISITGDTTALARVDSFGDLPIEDFEVITLGVSPAITLL